MKSRRGASYSAALIWLTLSWVIFPLIVNAQSPSMNCCLEIERNVPQFTSKAEFYFSQAPGFSVSYWTGYQYDTSSGLVLFNASAITESFSSSDGGIHEYGFYFALNASEVIGSSTPVDNFSSMDPNYGWVNYTETSTPPGMVETEIVNVSVPLSVWYDGNVAAGKSSWANFESAQGDSWTWNNTVKGFNGPALFVRASHLSITKRGVDISWNLPVPGTEGSGSPGIVTTQVRNVTIPLPPEVQVQQFTTYVVDIIKADPINVVILIIVVFFGLAFASGSRQRRRNGRSDGREGAGGNSSSP